MSLYSCNVEVGPFDSSSCEVRPGRIGFVSLLKFAAFDFLNGTGGGDWTVGADWDAQMAAGNIVVLGAVTGDYPEPSATEVDGVGRVESFLSSFSHVVNFETNGLIELNRDFFNDLNKNTEFYIAYVIDDPAVNAVHFVSDKPCSFRATPPVERGLDTPVRWKIKASWKSPEMPKMYAVPSGLYN